MTKLQKLVLTLVLGVIGIAFSTLYFAAAEFWSAPFWAEFSKWVPAVVVSALAFFAAQDSKETAQRAEGQAQAGRAEAERGRMAAEGSEREAKASREKAEVAERMAIASPREKRKVRKAVKKNGTAAAVPAAAECPAGAKCARL